MLSHSGNCYIQQTLTIGEHTNGSLMKETLSWWDCLLRYSSIAKMEKITKNKTYEHKRKDGNRIHGAVTSRRHRRRWRSDPKKQNTLVRSERSRSSMRRAQIYDHATQTPLQLSMRWWTDFETNLKKTLENLDGNLGSVELNVVKICQDHDKIFSNHSVKDEHKQRELSMRKYTKQIYESIPTHAIESTNCERCTNSF